MQFSNTIKEVYNRKDELFSLVCTFNSAPASYLHSSYLQGLLPPEPLEKILSIPRAQTKLNALLLEKFNLKNAFYTDFSSMYLRLALLDTTTLEELMLYAGIIYYSTNITQIVEKTALIGLKEKIGEKAYFFGVKKAPLFNRVKPQLTTLSPNPSNLYTGMLIAGQRMFEHLFAGDPYSITQRFQLKLPSDYTWNFGRVVTPEEKNSIYSFLHRLLIKEINPNWHLCFT